jgi:purine-binding chemotaxis protein CheW
MEQVMHVVVFTLGGERYALPIARVQEVIRHAHPRPVGSRIPFVAGVIELRGRLVPVCDVAARVGARVARSEQQKIVIVDLAGGQAGVLVDAVDEVVTVPEDRLAPVPAEVTSVWLSAIARLGDELVMVLDPERLLEGVIEEPEPVVVEPEPAPKPKRKPAARKPAAPRKRAAQPSRKRSEKATRSTAGADTGSPSSVTA